MAATNAPERPLVSVICTTFQHERFIAEALDGFLMQRTTFPFEIIVHDDASTDGTPAIIRRYAEKHPDKIVPVLQHVSHFMRPGSVTKAACDHARGKYLAMCEGDDFWTDPDKLALQVDAMEKDEGIAGCFHFTQQVYSDTGAEGRLIGKHGDRTHFTVKDTFSTYALCHYSSFMFRADIDFLPAWYATIKSGDMVIFSMVAKRGPLVCIPRVMSVYRKHGSGVTATDATKEVEHHRARIKLMGLLDAEHGYEYHEEAEQVIRSHKDQLAKLGFAERPGLVPRILGRLRSWSRFDER